MPESKNKDKPAIYLLDAYGIIYRSYFAFVSRPLKNAGGQNVSAIFGFTRTLLNLLFEGAPQVANDSLPRTVVSALPKRLAAIFDSSVPTFRHKMYPEYKATRQKTPDDLRSQFPLVEEALKSLGVPLIRQDGFEADDIIASLARQCREEGRQCYIVSSDKDLLQLVGGGVYQLRPHKASSTQVSQNDAGSYDVIGKEEVRAEWGVAPEKILDLLSLTGDSSDNVPGVKGIGEKTAVKLMARYGSLDEIYSNIAGIEGAIGKKLAEGRDSAYLSQSLIRLEDKVPLESVALDELSVENLDYLAGAAVLTREGIRQSAKQLEKLAGSGAARGAARGAVRGAASSANNAAGSHGSGGADPSGGIGGAVRGAEASLLGGGAYETILDFEKLEALFFKAQKQGLISLDFETDSLDAWNSRPIGLSFALEPKKAFYVPVASHRGLSASDTETMAPFLEAGKVRSLLAGLLADPKMTVAAHNAKYDYKVSRGWGLPRWKCRIWDTMVAAWVLDAERNSYSLDSLIASIFDHTAMAYNDIVPKGCAFDAVPLQTACLYSAEDADFTIRLKRHFEALLKKNGVEELFNNMEMPLLPILAEMEGAGIKIDSGILRDYGIELGKELKDIEKETYRQVGHEFNLGSTKQLQEVLFTERGLKPGKKTKTGYSTDVAVLEELAREDTVPALILRHRGLAKLKSTYVDTLADQADREGRLHTNFIQTGTATGRLSSRDPNLQNIPIKDEEGRRIRKAFIAKPGHVLISADYSQIELVVLAHLSKDDGLCSAFREGKDVHARTAALIFGLDEDSVPPEQRRIAKTINFGVMYGMSAFRLSNELKISRTDAAAFIDAYFKTYSGIQRFIYGIIAQTEETGYVSTIFGRRRYIPTINSPNKTEKAAACRVAVNTPIQGSAADIVKTAMLKLDAALAASASPARLLLQVHDELILECPKAGAEEAAAIVSAEMENAVKLSIPLRVNVETGKCWGDW